MSAWNAFLRGTPVGMSVRLAPAIITLASCALPAGAQDWSTMEPGCCGDGVKSHGSHHGHGHSIPFLHRPWLPWKRWPHAYAAPYHAGYPMPMDHSWNAGYAPLGDDCCAPAPALGCCGEEVGAPGTLPYMPQPADMQDSGRIPLPDEDPSRIRATPVNPGTPTPIVPRSNEPTPIPMRESTEKIEIPLDVVPLPQDAKARPTPATSSRFRPVPGAARAWYASSGAVPTSNIPASTAQR